MDMFTNLDSGMYHKQGTLTSMAKSKHHWHWNR